MLNPHAPALQFSNLFLFKYNHNTDQLTVWSRLVMLAIGVLLGVYVFLFARDLYGTQAGYLSLLLYCFSPNILSHATLATLEIGVTCFSFIAIYYLRHYLFSYRKKFIYLSGIFLGMSIAAKFTGLFLLPCFLLIRLLWMYKEPKKFPFKKSIYEISLSNKLIDDISILFIIALGIIILSYRIVNFHLFFTGILTQINNDNLRANSYLIGEFSKTGWWYYYFISFLIKSPLSLLILIACIILLYRKINPKTGSDSLNNIFILTPIFIIFSLSLLCPVNIGNRYILPVYPFLFIFAGQIMKKELTYVIKYTIVPILATWYVISSILIAPNFLAYFNELVGGPDNGYKYLIDSNIDWGQDLKNLAQYIKQKKYKKINISYWGSDSCKYRGIKCNPQSCKPQSGLFAISVTRLIGLKNCFSWLKNQTPIDKIGYSIFIYNITVSS